MLEAPFPQQSPEGQTRPLRAVAQQSKSIEFSRRFDGRQLRLADLRMPTAGGAALIAEMLLLRAGGARLAVGIPMSARPELLGSVDRVIPWCFRSPSASWRFANGR